MSVRHVTVTVRIDPVKLEKTMDPACGADQLSGLDDRQTLAAGKRQYVRECFWSPDFL